MTKTHIGRVLVAAAVATSGLVAVQGVTSKAEARCVGVGKPTVSRLVVGGVTWAWDTPVAGTCNNNGAYSTTVRVKPNFAGVVMKENGGVWTFAGSGKQGAQFPVSWSAASHKSNMSLCVIGALSNSIGTVTCGWGTHYSSRSFRDGQDLTSVLKSLAAGANNHGLNFGF